LTVIFVMVGEVLIFVPSVARFRLNYLQDRIKDAHLAILTLDATPDSMPSKELAADLLRHVGAHGIVIHKQNTPLILDGGAPPPIGESFDLRGASFLTLIGDAIMALGEKGNRVIRIIDASPKDPRLVVEVTIDEAPMRAALWDYGIRILELSIVISLITAVLLYIALQWLLVTPLRRLTAAMIAFRENPE